MPGAPSQIRTVASARVPDPRPCLFRGACQASRNGGSTPVAKTLTGFLVANAGLNVGGLTPIVPTA